MKHFQKMLEVVNEQGLAGFCPKSGCFKNDPEATSFFSTLAKDAQVFVFSPSETGPVSFNDRFDYKHETLDEMPEIDAPFQTFTIEMADGPITETSGDGEYTLFVDCILVHEDHQDILVGGVLENKLFYWTIMLTRVEHNDSTTSYFVTVDLAIEVDPRHEKDRITALKIKGSGRLYLPTYKSLKLVQTFLNRMSREASGQERVNFRTKLRSGGKKEFVKIRRIIHIAPKKTEKVYAGRLATAERREIEWSHAWFSRGHWRRLEPGHIGKNRTGDYVEFGRTWVTDSVKGPDHLKMIKKTYVVDPE